jgi:hypothetical protein
MDVPGLCQPHNPVLKGFLITHILLFKNEQFLPLLAFFFFSAKLDILRIIRKDLLFSYDKNGFK